MAVYKLASGRWRAQVRDPLSGNNVAVGKVLSPAEMRDLGADRGTFRTKTEAKRACAEAGARAARRRTTMTVREFWERWTTDPLFETRHESTMVGYRRMSRPFVERYGDVPLSQVDEGTVAEFLSGGRFRYAVPPLRIMFNQAASPRAGRLLERNPFANLGLEKSRGRKDVQPPSVEETREMVRLAWTARNSQGRLVVPPSFAAWYEVGTLTALRCGELDALEWGWVQWADGEIDVRRQFSREVGKFTAPKYGPYTVALTDEARAALERAQPFSGDRFVFVSDKGRHFTHSARTRPWDRLRAVAGVGFDMYTATRHYWAWRALNVLDLPSEVVAEQLGHRDGGRLVEELYGHPDRARRRAKIRAAFDATPRLRGVA